MAVITGYRQPGLLSKQTVPYDTYVGFDNAVYGDVLAPRDFYLSPSYAVGSIANNLPIDVEPTDSITGYRQPTFLNDYYFRIHVTPGAFDVGNLLSARVETITLWNAYPDPQQLLSTTSINADGIDVEQPPVIPSYFASLELRSYTITIGIDGSPIIDAIILYVFDNDSLSIAIVGRRVVVWPYKPKYPLKETFEWKTNIIQTFNGEQRIALRDAPRQSTNFEAVLYNQDFPKAKAIAYQWADKVFGMPTWIDIRHVSTVLVGSLFIDVDTTNADFRPDDIVLLWSSNGSYEAVETLAVTATRINLKLPVSATMSDVYITPVRFANAFSGVQFSRDSDAIIVASSDFDVRNNLNISADIGLPKHKTLQVLTDDVLSSEAVTDKYMRSMDVFDNGSGSISVEVKTNYVDILTKVSIHAFSPAEVWRYKQFFGSLYGRQKTFFIPSGSNDFTILDNIGSTSSSIRITNVNYNLYYDIQFIMLKLDNGSILFNRIFSSTVNVDGTEQLNLESTFGVAITASSIVQASILKHVRLDTDKIELTHSVGGRMQCSFVVREVPYVV